ncbi:hypothetical protein DOTSEDRAFT_30547 [Dothistroma septosporum NZE10]|uniref:Uncharacterized protein n=1 Tax=Dothistroma septosporum (strain NZE10 / CBS 128990) TaxID=675120 RepID=N1Q0S6_DOTSN|nr:hypothetical protein DOTSEDRAFT_30547 [Dothistroma septosporum NZE10]
MVTIPFGEPARRGRECKVPGTEGGVCFAEAQALLLVAQGSMTAQIGRTQRRERAEEKEVIGRRSQRRNTRPHKRELQWIPATIKLPRAQRSIAASTLEPLYPVGAPSESCSTTAAPRPRPTAPFASVRAAAVARAMVAVALVRPADASNAVHESIPGLICYALPTQHNMMIMTLLQIKLPLANASSSPAPAQPSPVPAASRQPLALWLVGNDVTLLATGVRERTCSHALLAQLCSPSWEPMRASGLHAMLSWNTVEIHHRPPVSPRRITRLQQAHGPASRVQLVAREVSELHTLGRIGNTLGHSSSAPAAMLGSRMSLPRIRFHYCMRALYDHRVCLVSTSPDTAIRAQSLRAAMRSCSSDAASRVPAGVPGQYVKLHLAEASHSTLRYHPYHPSNISCCHVVQLFAVAADLGALWAPGSCSPMLQHAPQPPSVTLTSTYLYREADLRFLVSTDAKMKRKFYPLRSQKVIQRLASVYIVCVTAESAVTLSAQQKTHAEARRFPRRILRHAIAAATSTRVLTSGRVLR